MAKLIISNEFIKKVKPPKDKDKEQYFDSELKGFMIEVKATGSKTYYRYYTASTQKN